MRIILLILLAVLALATPAQATLVFNGDCETGDLSQWGSVTQFAPGRASVVTSPRVQGNYACRLEVRDGEYIGSDSSGDRERTQIEVYPQSRHHPVEGSDWWYGFWVYFPATTPLPGNGARGGIVLTSWPSTQLSDAPEINGHLEIRDTTVGGDPGPGYSDLHYEDGGSRADGHKYFWRKRLTDVTRNVWHRFLIHRKYSANESIGFIELWYDGVQQTLVTNAAGATGLRAFHRTMRPGESNRYIGASIYRGLQTEPNAVIYFDGHRVGTTRADVEPAAPPPPPPVIWSGPLRVSLVPAYNRCISPNRTHGPPLASPSCAPPAQASVDATVGTFDANGFPAQSTGSFNASVVVGNPNTTPDEADVRLSLSIDDVRQRFNEADDYTGELQGKLALRITDRRNGPSEVDPGTMRDIPMLFTFDCIATADAGTGAVCALTTTADTLAPGTVREGARSVWQVGQVRVFDGGEDGFIQTQADNNLFLRQGIFVP